MKIALILGPALAVIAALAGCTSLSSLGQSDAAARTLIEIATMAAIEQSHDRVATATEVARAANEAKSWLDLSGVTMTELAAKARERIAASKAELSEKAALNALVNVIEAQVSAQVTTGAIDPQVRVRLNTVLDWIIGAARAYAG